MAWLLSLWSSLVLFLTRKRLRDVAAYATAILPASAVLRLADVFYRTVRHHQRAPNEGWGLIRCCAPHDDDHPDLYSATRCARSARFGMGALLARRIEPEWIRVIRALLRCVVVPGIGILLGGAGPTRSSLGRLLGGRVENAS